MAVWKSLEIQVPGKDLLEPARSVLETLVVYLEILKALLDTIQAALVDFGNPIRALVEALIKMIEELILSLMATGAHGYFDVPDLAKDPQFAGYLGGWPAFLTRFEASLNDAQDYNRPQPRQGSTTSGFVLMVTEGPDPLAMYYKLKALLEFFGKSFEMPRLLAPTNFEAFPVGSSGDPITALAKLFSDGPIKAIELKWDLPTSQSVGDPGFTDMIAKTVGEFVPPAFLIERATIRPVQMVDGSKDPSLKTVSAAADAGDLDLAFMTSNDETTVGQVVKLDPTGFGDPRAPTKFVLRKAPLVDSYGEPFIKFNHYFVVDAASLTSIAGQSGTYRWIDSDVEEGLTYWYRVRAFHGTLAYSESSKMIQFKQAVASTEQGRKILEWPSADGGKILMGQASGILEATVPTTISSAEFDVMDLVARTFTLAYSLDFHAPSNYNAPGAWTSDGYPATGVPSSAYGQGTLENYADSISSYRALHDIDLAKRLGPLNQGQAEALTLEQEQTAADYGIPLSRLQSGKGVQLPIQKKTVLKQSARMTHNVVMAMMQQGTTGANPFRDLLEGSWPRPLNQGEQQYTNLKDMIEKLTWVDEYGQTNLETQERLIQAYDSLGVRANLQVVTDYLKGLALSGVPKNWVSIVPLRDIVPWCGQLIYDLLAKIDALLAAFSGVMSEISSFIELLERKIQALEDFLQYLIEILNFVESLQFDVYLLNAQGISGGTQDWMNIIRGAGGTPPNSNPAYYTAGVAFAYAATDPTAFVKAFGTIFGGA
jgi:hypothetical protein